MNKDKLVGLLEALEIAKELFQNSYESLMEIVDAIEEEVFDVKEAPAESQESIQNRLNDTLSKQKLVSQLRDQLDASVAVVEPSTENVNESHGEDEVTTPLTEQFRSQLGISPTEESSTVSLAEQLRSQLEEQEGQMELYVDEDVYVDDEAEEIFGPVEEEEEEEDYENEDEVEENESLSPLVQSLRDQIKAAELAELPDPDGDDTELPVHTSDAPNLSDVLRNQMNTPSVEETVVKPVLTMEEMIQLMRNDINNTTDVEDKEKEEELVVAVAASSDNDVTASLRQQLLVQELKKQLG